MTMTEPVTTTSAVLEAARLAASVGIVVLPAKPDGTKQPGVGQWKQYQGRRPTRDELRTWFYDQQQDGLGFVCGSVSGGLEMLEFEDMQSYDAFVQLAQDSGLGDLVDRVREGYEEATPGGGVHLFYRAEELRGNTKLAARPCPGEPVCSKHVAGKTHVLVETRGDGGWVVVAPSAGRTHASGRAYERRRGSVEAIVTVSAEERDELWRVARTLDEMPVVEHAPAPRHEPHETDGTRPGDLFNAQASWDDVLTPHGWRRLFQRGHLTYWRRPGKDHGISATTGLRSAGDPSSDLLWVFSTSTEFEAEAGYSKWRAYAVLNTGGDFAAAARDLKAQGYSEPDIGPLVAVPSDVELMAPVERHGPPPEKPYRFTSVFPDDHFVSRYIAYAARRTDAPHEYHEAIATTLLATVTPGVKAHLSAWPNGLATNLFCLIVGDSTRSRKSTALSIGKALLNDSLSGLTKRYEPPALLPERMTPEAMIQQLSQRTRTPALWIAKEFGDQLKAIRSKKYMSDLEGYLLEVYDGDAIRRQRASKRVQGGEVVEDADVVMEPYLSLLGATTKAVFRSLSVEDVETGLLPRFAIIMPSGKPPRMPVTEVAPTLTQDALALQDYLLKLRLWAMEGDPPTVHYSPEALAILNEFEEEIEEEDRTILARLPAMAYKLAMVAALGEEVPAAHIRALTVERHDAEHAVGLARRWRSFAMSFSLEIGSGADIRTERIDRKIEKVVQHLRASENCSDWRTNITAMLRPITKEEADNLGATMVDLGLITIEAVPTGRRGPQPQRWVLVGHGVSRTDVRDEAA